MPVFNNALYLNEAIDCILNQSFKDFEFIILNDGSTDGSDTIIEKYSKLDQRIVFVNDYTNKGFIYRLNQGLKLAKGDFIARTDGDDICVLDRFEKQIRYLETHPDITLCSGWFEYIGAKTGVITLPLSHDEIKVHLLEYSPIVHALMMCRRSFLTDQNLEYDPTAIAAEDYDLWTRIVGKATFANLPFVMLKYRMHPTQTSAKHSYLQWKNSDKCRVRMLNYIWDLKNEEDKRFAGLIAHPSSILKMEDAEKVLTILDELVFRNKDIQFFDENGFDHFIRNRKKNIVRYFYHNKKSYNFNVLAEFYNSPGAFRRELSAIDKVKIIIKCFILWQKKK
jgi:glycosyltransferase involved in cell wall biosynthesis